MTSLSQSLPIYDADELTTSWNEEDLIGCGSFATVRKCHHKVRGQVAVKCFSVVGTKEMHEQALEKIAREENILSLIDHPNIIRIYATTRWANCVGIVMEYVNGKSLEDLLYSNRRLSIPWGLRLRFMADISDGLAYLHYNKHEHVFIHGDLKPQNILLTSDLSVKIADFGSANIAKATGAASIKLVITNSTQHTISYTAPEYLKDTTIDRTRAMDVYSLSLIDYEIITRQPVFLGVSPSVIVQLIMDKGQKPDMGPIRSMESSLAKRPKDLQILNTLKRTMEECWNFDSRKRPDVRFVRKHLRSELCKLDQEELASAIQDVIRQNDQPRRPKGISSVPLKEFLPPFRATKEPETPHAADTTPSYTQTTGINCSPGSNNGAARLDTSPPDDEINTPTKDPRQNNDKFGRPRSCAMLGLLPPRLRVTPQTSPIRMRKPQDDHMAKVVNLLKATPNGDGHKLEFDVGALEKILHNPYVTDRPVALYSIIGPSRTGKSFLLNLIMRFLIKDKDFYLGGQRVTTPDDELHRWFGLAQSKDRQSPGIYVLNKPFIAITKTHGSVALFLMDTQGIFSQTSTAEDLDNLAALTYLISSYQMFNLKRSVEGNDLPFIYKLVKFAKRLRRRKRPPALQNLAFLIRDWRKSVRYSHGFDGGENYIRDNLQSRFWEEQEHGLSTGDLDATFDVISCFLFPQPGLEVMSDEDENQPCKFEDIAGGFVGRTELFVREAFSPEKLVVKKVNGKIATGKELFDFIKVCANSVIENGVDVSKFILAMDNLTMSNNTSKCSLNYVNQICQVFQENSLNLVRLDFEHSKIREETLRKFEDDAILGDQAFIDKWRLQLETILAKYRDQFQVCVNAETVYSEALSRYKSSLSYGWKFKSDERNNELLLQPHLQHLKSHINQSVSEQCRNYFRQETKNIFSKFCEENMAWYHKMGGDCDITKRTEKTPEHKTTTDLGKNDGFSVRLSFGTVVLPYLPMGR